MDSSAVNRPVLKELKCPNCGHPIQQHVPDAQTLICGKCGSYVGIGAEEAAVLSKAQRFPGAPVPITIGGRYTLDGVEYFVMGRVMYRGWDSSDTSDYWVWDEWQLGASDGRVLWLSYDKEDGFVLYKKLRLREQFDPRKSGVIPAGEKRVPVKERYPARIVGAEGELTFQAKPGDQLYMVEGESGGLHYSLQATDEEIELYEGQPVNETAIAMAMNDKAWVTRIDARKGRKKTLDFIGVACLIFAVIALVLAVAASQTGELVLNQDVTIDTTNPVVTVPVEFHTAAGRPAIIQTKLLDSIPVNTDIEANVSVVAPNEKKTLVYSQEFYNESGVEDGETWYESKLDVGDLFVPYLDGAHSIEIALDTTLTGTYRLNLEVRQNHMVPGWMLGYGFVVGAVGLMLLLNGSGAIKPIHMLVIVIVVIVIVVVLSSGIEIGDVITDILDEM